MRRSHVEYADSAPVVIHADAGQLQVVLVNLLLNAAQATRAEANVRVDVAASRRAVSHRDF